MKEAIKKSMMLGDFKQAKECLMQKDRDCDLKQIVFELGFDEESISAYAFMCYLINGNETPEYHYLASEVLSTALCHLPDAYACALFHAKRAVALRPEDITLKEYLLFFREIPDNLIGNEEAKKIAKEILKTKPDSEAARTVLTD